MALQKQPLEITFAGGIDTKTDPDQVNAATTRDSSGVSIGKLLALENAVFNGGALNKRNGFGNLTTLPNSEQTNLLTLNDNLLATGSNLYAYSATTNQWLDRGSVRPVDVEAKPLVRNSGSQTVTDAVVDADGQVCVAYKEGSAWYYQVNDASTGQAIVARTALPVNSAFARTYLLGRYFIVTFLISGPNRLQFIAIPTANPTAPHAAVTISSTVSSASAAYDGVVANNNLYVAYDANDGGGAIRLQYLTSSLGISSASVIAGETADLLSAAADTMGNTAVLYFSYYNGSIVRYTAYSPILVQILAPTTLATATVSNLTGSAASSVYTVFYEVVNTYSWGTPSNYVAKNTGTQAGVVGTPSVVLRSVGLASKSLIQNSVIYLVVAYGGAFQPTYFLIDSSGNILTKLAYSNGGGYATTQILPNITEQNSDIYFPYLFKDLLVPVNKEQGAASVAGVYAQTGINLAKLTLTTPNQYSSEIASTLHLTGGIFWMYDSVKPVEHGFHVWPEDVNATSSTTGGFITNQVYYYYFTYEWTDSQGNLHRSAPSNPIAVDTSAAGTNTSTNTLKVPTLRLTYKTAPNSVRIVGYRWSTGQQVPYQFTSISSPVLNDPNVDSVTIIDTLADSSIIGNVILYTFGGIVENIGAPASRDVTLCRSRLFIIDAEDTNLLWYSKQVIESTPVELSDLFTIFVAPTSGAQGSTGGMTAISSMDDKLIIFKKDAVYYITGNGPDNTGSNNDFSEPVFITGAVGCANPNSIVLTPMGLMFQSDKGIWLLGRDLSTKYVGADVESYNTQVVKSGLVIPGTNQVRFTLESGSVLMFDYFYQQWGTFTSIPGISACLFNGTHTYLNSNGIVRQETQNKYLDGTAPVLMSFTTAWMRLTNLQGYQRAYQLFLLSNYITPHKLNIQIAYDYDETVKQSTIFSPDNFSPAWGNLELWGSGEFWGGPSNIEQPRIFLKQQRCQSVQVTISEQFDSTKGVQAGAGLKFSGLNMLIGAKAPRPTISAKQSAG